MDVDALKALILSQQQQLRSKDEQLLSKDQQLLSKDEQLLSRDHEIEHLKLLIAKLQRMQFGRKSEKVERQIEQLTLKLEELETSRAEREPEQEPAPASGTQRSASAKKKPSRRPLPEHLLRITKVHQPAQQACPQCGGALQKLGEDVSEVLDYIPASFLRHSPCASQAELLWLRCDCAGTRTVASYRTRLGRGGTARPRSHRQVL